MLERCSSAADAQPNPNEQYYELNGKIIQLERKIDVLLKENKKMKHCHRSRSRQHRKRPHSWDNEQNRKRKLIENESFYAQQNAAKKQKAFGTMNKTLKSSSSSAFASTSSSLFSFNQTLNKGKMLFQTKKKLNNLSQAIMYADILCLHISNIYF